MQENSLQLAEELEQLAPRSVAVTDNLFVYLLPSSLKPQYPAVYQGLGYARKEAFSLKGAGGCTECDIDDFDDIYHQMLVVEKRQGRAPEIIGGYRFYYQQEGQIQSLDMERLFSLQPFYQHLENMPAIELGRSFLIPRVQKHSDVFFSLLSGLGIILNLCSDAKFFFGKITFYPGNQKNGEVLRFLEAYHGEGQRQIIPREEVTLESSIDFTGMDYIQALKQVKNHMPEILRIYLRFTQPQYAIVSGTAANEAFGSGILETAFRIFIPKIGDIWYKRFLFPFRHLQGRRSEFLNF